MSTCFVLFLALKKVDIHAKWGSNTELTFRTHMKCASQDVGSAGDGRDGYGYDNPGSESYLSLNGLTVEDDAVLGDYDIWAEGAGGTSWTITARSGGEVLWVSGGVFSEFQRETERFTATVSAYAESDCTIDAYGE